MNNDSRQTWLETALREGEIQLLHLIDAMPHMVWMASVEQGCEFVNQRWVEYAGVSVQEVLGAEWTKLVHPADRERTYDAWAKGSVSDEPFQVNCRIRGRDGQYRWFDTRGVPLRNSQNKVIKWFGTNTDIHDAVAAREALAENEERLRYVSLASHDCVYDWSIHAGQTYRNETYQKLFGAPAIARSSERWWEQRIHPDDRQRVVDSAAAAFNARQPMWRDEYRLQRADRGYANVTDHAYLLYDDENKPSRMIGAIADITERISVEQSLRDAQARLLAAIEGAQIGTWIWDIGANLLRWDDAAFDQWGLTPTSDNNIDFATTVALIHDQDRPGIEAAIAEFFRTGVEQVVEFRIQRPDGKTPWLQIRGRVERDAAGKPMRMAGVYIDITERKHFEQSLRDAQARLLSAMAAGGLATWIWDIVGDELYWDDAAYRLWGRQPGEFDKLSFVKVIEMMHPDDRPRIAASGEDFFRTGVEVVVEFRTTRPDGALQWLMTKGEVERDASGTPVRMVGVYVDITERKRAEEARLASQKMEALGTLAGGIAHDFNNLLLVIAGNTRLALDDLDKGKVDREPIERTLREIGKASLRASELVKRILTFSRHQEAKRESVSLRPLVEEALRLLHPTLPASIEIRTSLDRKAPAATVDTIQIHQVIMNLVTNAAHAIGSRHGTIDVELSAKQIDAEAAQALDNIAVGEYVCLIVRDDGSGIDPGVLGRIFDPFFTTKKPGEGTGLGLAVVHGIVKAQGGAIAVRSKVDRGSEFSVYLPAAGTDIAATATLAALPLPGAGQHVLYVDDEESLVYLIVRVLERLGYRVTGCVDPEQALAELRTDPRSFDVLVTDLAMRGMNGFELTSAVHAVRPDLPVLLTSGYLRTEDRETAQQLGIRELILKPNTVEELGQAIDRALAAARRQLR